MSKMYFHSPVINPFDIGDGDDPGLGGGGSAHGGQDPLIPYPCSYDYWLQNYSGDYNDDKVTNFDDYGIWWLNNHFTEEQWKMFNNNPFPTFPTQP